MSLYARITPNDTGAGRTVDENQHTSFMLLRNESQNCRAQAAGLTMEANAQGCPAGVRGCRLHTSGVGCPCLPTPTCVGCVRLMTGGWRALVTLAAVFPAVRWTELLSTTAVSAVVACWADGCCCWLCWMKAAESGVSCLKAGKLLWVNTNTGSAGSTAWGPLAETQTHPILR